MLRSALNVIVAGSRDLTSLSMLSQHVCSCTPTDPDSKQTHQRLRNLAKSKPDGDSASTHTSECAICLMSIAVSILGLVMRLKADAKTALPISICRTVLTRLALQMHPPDFERSNMAKLFVSKLPSSR